MTNITVLGAGTWGMALARMLAVQGHGVTVWSAIPAELEELATTHRHKNLPGMSLPDSLAYTPKMEEACRDAEVLLFAVPSVFVRSTARAAQPFVRPGQIIVDVAKGIEADTQLTMTGVIGSEMVKGENSKNVPLVALSGPTHAEEVALDLPTAIVAASPDTAATRRVQDVFMNPNFRVYTNEDVLGVELAGALKNVIALSVGISTGLGFGDNAKAALVTRGNAEITRLGVAMGGRAETFAGLAGLGDLVVTCTSMHSRNFRAGMLIGQGHTAEQAKAQVGMVVEGIYAIAAAMQLQKKYGVELPIISTADAVINRGLPAREAVVSLMMRDKKSE